jgi:hypothetical protein
LRSGKWQRREVSGGGSSGGGFGGGGFDGGFGGGGFSGGGGSGVAGKITIDLTKKAANFFL